jgi:hypothetical protein
MVPPSRLSIESHLYFGAIRLLEITLIVLLVVDRLFIRSSIALELHETGRAAVSCR